MTDTSDTPTPGDIEHPDKAYETPPSHASPPHMIQVTMGVPAEDELEHTVEVHIEDCEECQAWAEENSSDWVLWVWRTP